MHDGMPCDAIQGQRHGASEVPIIALFKVYLLHDLQWELAVDHRFLNYIAISKFVRAECLILSHFLCHVTLNLEGSLRLVRQQKRFSDFNEI